MIKDKEAAEDLTQETFITAYNKLYMYKSNYKFFDNNLTREQREEMIKHIKDCDSCRKKYNYEKKINDDFKSILHDYDPGFVSSRRSIMSKIDKKKYPMSLTEKAGYKLKKNRWIAVAALIAVITLSSSVIAIPKIINMQQSAVNKNASVSAEASVNEKSEAIDDKKEEANKSSEKDKGVELKKQENKGSQPEDSEKGTEKTVDIFSKDVPSDSVIKSMNSESQTPWEVNKENKYSACVLGKGEYAEEEGYASLIIKNPKGAFTEYKLKNEKESQTTILQTEWLDNDRILVVTGSAYGTLVTGQQIYSININTDMTKLEFQPSSKRERIKKIQSKGNKRLQITIAQYTDETMNEYKETIKMIAL